MLTRLIRDDIDAQREHFAKLCLTAAIQFERGDVQRALANASRLWNHADNQTDCEFLWSLLAIACPWSFGNPENINSHFFTYAEQVGTPQLETIAKFLRKGWRFSPLWVGSIDITRMQKDEFRVLIRRGEVLEYQLTETE